MSTLNLIKQVLGLSSTASQNHYWDGSIANQLSLKRGTPASPGAKVIDIVDGQLRARNVTKSALAALPTTSILTQAIPAGVRKISIQLSQASVSATTYPIIRLGTSAGIDSSNYNGYYKRQSHNAYAGVGIDYSGLFIYAEGAANSVSGRCTIELVDEDTNYWWLTFGGFTSDGYALKSEALCILSDKLTQLQITSYSGAYYDAGNYVIDWEY